MIFGMRAKLIAAAVIGALCFGGGWAVNGWRYKAKENADNRAVIAALQKETERLREFNDKAAKRESETITSIRVLNTEIGKIKDEIANLEMGGCSLTPDADRVRIESHRQAFPPR